MADDRNDFVGDEGFPSRDWPGGGDSVPRDDDAFDEPAEPSRGGGGWKLALIIVAISVLVLILCCGGLAYFGFQWVRDQTQFTNNPEEIRTWTDEIIAIDIPDDYVPNSGAKFGMGQFMAFTVLTYFGPEEARLFLVELSGQAASDPQNHPQLEQSLRDGVAGQAKVIQEESSEIHEVDINGETVDFKLVTGPESATGEEWTELSGVVPTERGMVLVLIQAPVESFNEEEALSVVQSIGD